MALEQEIYSINMVALNVVNAIHGIQIGYLLGNKKYPYGEVNKLIAEYMILFNKYSKKKNSIINKIVNGFDSERRLAFKQLNLMDDRQILINASKKTLFHVCLKNDKYIPYNEESVFRISDKLFPIIKELDMDTIVSLYHKFQDYIPGDESKEKKLLHLQQLHMGYVMYKLRIHNCDKSTAKLTYEEACKYILGEDVLSLSEKYTKKKVAI